MMSREKLRHKPKEKHRGVQADMLVSGVWQKELRKQQPESAASGISGAGDHGAQSRGAAEGRTEAGVPKEAARAANEGALVGRGAAARGGGS